MDLPIIIRAHFSNDHRCTAGTLEAKVNFFGLLATESLTAFTLSGHLAVSFLPDLGCLLTSC